MNPAIRKRTVKFGLKNVFNAFHHEIDNGLRCIDDTMRIGNLDRKALEKLLIDGVEEVLFLGEVVNRRCGAFNHHIK